MPRVKKVTGGRVNVRGIGEFEAGDEADVSTAHATYLVDERGDFEVVESDAGGDGPADEDVHEEDGPPDDAPSGRLPFDPEAHTVSELREKVTQVDDVEVLRALKDLEAEQKDRETAAEAIDSRIAELEA